MESEDSTEKAVEEVNGPPSDFGSTNWEWRRHELERATRRLGEGLVSALPDGFAYAAVALAGLGSALGLAAILTGK